MKFKFLSVGQKFEYQGEIYVKTSPLIASDIKTSHNKMIPAYVMLTLLDDVGTHEKQIKETPVNADEILSAFNVFYEKTVNTLETNNVLVPRIKDEIDKARDEFTQHLTR